MEIGSQIKRLRAENNLSQDDLALKIYVSRQTISNWENDKNYPDVKSLLLLGSLFDVTLDQLIKGDIDQMKKLINTDEIRVFKRDGDILAALFILSIISAVPLFMFLNVIGIIIWGVIAIMMFYFASRVEKHKKNYNVQTYKEIVNFLEGKQLSEKEVQQEFGKRKYQKLLIVTGFTLVSALIAIGIAILLDQII